MYGHSFSTTTIPLTPQKKTNTLLFIHLARTHLVLAAPKCLLSNDAAHKGLVNLKDLRKDIDPAMGKTPQPRNSANPRGSIPGENGVFSFLVFFRWGGVERPGPG